MSDQNHCSNEFLAAMGEHLGEAAGSNILARMKESGFTPEQIAREKNNFAYSQALAKRTIAVDVAARARIKAATNKFISKGLKPNKAFEADSLGSVDPRAGTRDNAASRRDSLQQSQWGQFYAKTNRAEKFKGELWKVLRDPANAVNLAEARIKAKGSKLDTPNLDALSKKDPVKAEQIQRVAKILNESLDRARQTANHAGSLIPDHPDYFGAQVHDRAKIKKAAGTAGVAWGTKEDAEAWKSDISKPGMKIDIEKTRQALIDSGRLQENEKFDGEKFRQSLWEVLSGLTRKDIDGGPAAPKLGGVLERGEMSRIIQFETPADAARYNAKYGSGSVLEGHVKQLDHLASLATTLEFYGNDPKGNLQQVKNEKLVELRDKLDGQHDLLAGAHDAQMLDAYLGNVTEPGNQTLAHYGANIRAIQRMARLGSATITNLEQIFTAGLAARYAGVGHLQSYFLPLFSQIRRNGSAAMKEFAQSTGASCHAQLGNIMSQIDKADPAPGSKIKNLEHLFFKAIGMSSFDGMIREGYVTSVSNAMATKAESRFEELPQNIQRHLQDYNISPSEWDVIRQHAFDTMDPDNPFAVLKSDKIRDAADVEPRLRVSAEQKLANLFLDSADYASVRPDMKTQHLLVYNHLPAGTVKGEVWRMTTQFLSFNVAHGQKVLQRGIKAGAQDGGIRGVLASAATMGAGLIMTGIIVQECKRIIQGQDMLFSNPKLTDDDPAVSSAAWAKILVAGAGQSGVGGIFGDLLFSQGYLSGHADHSAVNVLGPTADTITHGLELAYNKILNGKGDGVDLERYIRGNLPGQNIWWLRPIINYALTYGLEEYMRPGTLQRMEEKAKEQGAPYYASPSQMSVW